jgi:hypothetical protein
MYLAYPTEDRNPNGAWGAGQAFQSGTYNGGTVAPGEVIADGTYVICAANTRGQQRYQYGAYNAYCYSGYVYPTNWGFTRPGIAS